MTRSQKNLMTEGSIWKKIVTFAIPVFLGSLFQQLYNTVDSLIVGNFIGSSSLAAVSSAGNLIFLLIGFFYGLSMGAGVVIAAYIGAKDAQNTKIAVHTTVFVGLISSVLLTLIGIFFSPLILRLMGTPEEVMTDSVNYFRIYFAGATSFIMYNIFVGILQAAGDSRHPLYFLIISSVLNILLDLLFIGVFKQGVGSAALATVISQTVSTLLCMIQLLKTKEDYRLEIKSIKPASRTLLKILKFGIPSGIQNSIIGFANVVVQSYINYFGAMAMAGSGAYSKIEGFAFLPITSFCMAVTTFTSQNLGARNFDRMKKGARFGTICSTTLAEIIGLITWIFAPTLIKAFDSTPEVLVYGIQRARTCALFYCLLAYSHSMAAILRGSGKAVVPMVVMMVCWCIIRVSILAVSGLFIRTIEVVNWVYPITWCLSSITFTIYYITTYNKTFDSSKSLEESL